MSIMRICDTAILTRCHRETLTLSIEDSIPPIRAERLDNDHALRYYLLNHCKTTLCLLLLFFPKLHGSRLGL